MTATVRTIKPRAGVLGSLRVQGAWWYWLVPVALGLGAFYIRAVGLRTANEVFIDELTYVDLARDVADGYLPNLNGELFFLHPPGWFLVTGLVVKAFGLTGSAIEVVYQLRWLNAVLGALVVVLAYLITRRVNNAAAATLVAVVLAFDPFVLRMDSRVMMETPTTALLMAGWLVLLPAVRHSAPWRPVVAGLLFGCAVLVKDIGFVLAVVPLLLALVWRRTLAPRLVLVAAGATIVPYAIYLVFLLLGGHLGDWWTAKSLGLGRMAGLVQISGFNAPNAPNLGSRLVEEVGRFGTSYVLILLCLLAGVGASFSASAPRRLIGLIALVSGALGVYAAFIGTLEEQFGYYVVVPSALALAVVAVESVERGLLNRKLVVGVAVAFAALTAVLGLSARLVTDDAYRRVDAWLTKNVPPGTKVGLTGVTAEFAYLPRTGYGVWPSLESLAKHDAEYVVTQRRSLRDGYGYAAPELLDWLSRNALPVYSAGGPTGEQTTVWQLSTYRTAKAVRTGERIPPVNGPHE
ncbi:ArnT family glycosyltransferase [Saccharothrix obliqua]|uniref:ArnT family glycosyltransferase n=1 Tax=Saccharothrix obliqua TaxID=2861747 RepID=UPI001C5D7860|nr:glycosyltransferase family 39 protein [Saccharothrix obliqua]MBW4718137.1 phospholipid carrier-dependent glycosyltransferase [Saccharothrix obliqua]